MHVSVAGSISLGVDERGSGRWWGRPLRRLAMACVVAQPVESAGGPDHESREREDADADGEQGVQQDAEHRGLVTEIAGRDQHDRPASRLRPMPPTP